jgi:hypothetical protein
MRFPTHRIARLEAWFDRRTAFLRHERAPFLVALLVPVLFGLLSVALGQDDNWDLRNYHWYNPYALLNDRLHVDMAPGNWQSYFNPMIDVPYYVLNQWLPGPAVGFVMGFVHGLNFILLLAIVRLVLPRDKADMRLCLLLAAAGMCGAGFLSEVGNTMGDNFSALFVLAALGLVLRAWDRLQTWSGRTAAVLLLAGLVMGLGAGLKLTNTSYAVALCVALLAVPASLGLGVASAFVYGCGTLAGVAIAAGPWWWRMWRTFGNPLFPQFNSIFKSPLAQQVSVIDAFHLPHNALEALFWPFVFTAHFTRVSELAFRQAIVPALYALALVFVGRWLFEKVTGRAPAARLSARARFLLLFALVGYLAWMKLFSIYRYLIPIEMLAPLLVWILVARLAAPRARRRNTPPWPASTAGPALRCPPRRSVRSGSRKTDAGMAGAQALEQQRQVAQQVAALPQEDRHHGDVAHAARGEQRDFVGQAGRHQLEEGQRHRDVRVSLRAVSSRRRWKGTAQEAARAPCANRTSARFIIPSPCQCLSTQRRAPIASSRNSRLGAAAVMKAGQVDSMPMCENRLLISRKLTPIMMPMKILKLTPPLRTCR